MTDVERVLDLIYNGVAAVADEHGDADTARAATAIVLSTPPELLHRLAALALPALIRDLYAPPATAEQTTN